MNWRDEVLEAVSKPGYRPLMPHDLASKLDVAPEDTHRFLRLLRAMAKDGLIHTMGNGRVCLPERAGLITGTLSMTYRGEAEIHTALGERWLVDASDTAGAVHGDRVLAKPRVNTSRSKRAQVTKVLARKTTQLTGVYYQHRGYGEVRPDEHRYNFRLFVSNSDAASAQDGDRVLVHIERYASVGRDARGRVLEVFGASGDTRVDERAILERFGFSAEFTPDAMRQADEVAVPVAQAERQRRRDLRQHLVVTIDGEDAKDFDDAVSIEDTESGWILGVHIADVSHYVKPNTALDRAASHRGTSVYLTSMVCPMLPSALSEDIASLMPDEERLTVSVFIPFDRSGEPGVPEIVKSAIKSSARLTYSGVNRFFEGLHSEFETSVSSRLLKMRDLARLLAAKRQERGSLDFDITEYKVVLDDRGEPEQLMPRERGEAERLIEEFMIAANEQVAQYLFHLGMPCMYRVHERPDSSSLEDLNLLLERFGYRVRGTANPHPKAVQSVLRECAGKPEQRLVQEAVLRSLKKARYSGTWLGHFGLASALYCHFTSPIRRYPDLLVHRVLTMILDAEWKPDLYTRVMACINDAADHCSEREYQAELAERESLKLMQAKYMKRNLGETFWGTITDVTYFGAFVELDNGVSGLIHISALGDDFYTYDEAGQRIFAKRSRQVFRAGQRVLSQVAKVDVLEARVDLVLVK